MGYYQFNESIDNIHTTSNINIDFEKERLMSTNNSLNILFLGDGDKKCVMDSLKWTISHNQKVVGVITKENSTLSKVAKEGGIPVISMEEAEEMVTDGMVDLCVSVLYWRRIKEPLISGPKLGCINFHPAILPDYKGLGGCSMAILDKLDEWGVSAHYVDENFDTGEIIKVFRFSFDYRNETGYSLKKKTESILFDLYKSVVGEQIDSKQKFYNTVSNTGGTYVSRKMMLDLMRIDLEADDIVQKIHAFWFPPYDGAYIEVDGSKYTLVDSDIIKSYCEGK